MPNSIDQLNQMDETAFVAALGAIFEDTPEIARRAWSFRPFADIDALHKRMVSIVHDLSVEEKLTLIRAHPDLGTRAKMAAASVQEQAGVGLDRLSPTDFARFQSLNQAYRQKFAFPFLIAVKGQTLETILNAFESRLNHDITAEIAQALTEITKIARFRLEDSLQKP